ncbi:MAG TPA: hypothetical protein VFE62_23480 [Gemmataceae bacterium]|nr:hypothetical protein [Gemmataceae bacterium]
MPSLLGLPVVSEAELERREQIRLRAITHTAEKRKQEDAFGRLIYHRHCVIVARMTEHGIEHRSYLGSTILALQSLNWLGTAHEKTDLRRAAEFHRPYVAAALQNPLIVESMTPAAIEKNPPVRMRYEEASAYGSIGECIAATRSKLSWGKLVSIDTVEKSFPFGRQRIQYVYHATSRYNQRFEQRKYLKRRLGGEHRRLVADAMSSTKRDFLKSLDERCTVAIQRRVGLDGGEFWKVVKGLVLIELPATLVQMDLFG